MGRIKHLLHRDGRYYARLVVPPDLRRAVGRTELRKPLGPDKRGAQRALHGAVAELLNVLDEARAREAQSKSVSIDMATLQTVARAFYERELGRASIDTIDADGVNETRKFYWQHHAGMLRRVMLGQVSEEEAEAVAGWAVDEALALGDLPAPPAPAQRRELVRTLAAIQLEACERRNEFAAGKAVPGEPKHPLLREGAPAPPAGADMGAAEPVTRLNEQAAKPLSQLLPLFHAERRVREATRREHEVAVRMFEEFMGDGTAVGAVTRHDVLAYKNALLKTPSNYTKRFPGLALPEAIEANSRRVQPFSCLNPSTINGKWLAHLRASFGWCVNNGILGENPAAGVRVDTGGGYAATDEERKPFSAEDLRRIFGSELFAHREKFEDRQWMMLIALHTGARAAEIAQLRVSDVRLEAGIWVFDLLTITTKNRHSKRIVPVHKDLLALGLTERASRLQEKGQERLLPGWPSAKSGKYADTLPRWFNRTYLRSVGIDDNTKVFHSFRHTFKTALSWAGVPPAIHDAITGHRDASAAGKYVHAFPLKEMAAALSRVRLLPETFSVPDATEAGGEA